MCRWSIALLVLVSLCFAGDVAGQTIGGQVFSGPLLPQVTPSVAFPPDAGYTHTAIASGANLQTALTGAACGTKLLLAAGGSFLTGSAYTLPNTACTCHVNGVYDLSKYVIIQSDDPSYTNGSVRGTRIDPSTEYTKLAHISSTDANYAFTITNNGTDCYWFGPGLDIGGAHSPGNTAVISWGDGSFSVANYPHDVVIDHSYIHGQSTLNQQRCLQLNGNWMAVVDSYLSDCHYVGTDAQAIEMWDGQGPLLVKNNFVSGSGENSMIGGATGQTGINQCDITFDQNHYFKPLAWRIGDPMYAGIHWSIKNAFEFKGGCRVLATRNVFENDWADAQTGQILIFKTSTNSWSVVSDFTVYLNVIRHAAGAYAVGCDGPGAPYPMSDHRMSFTNNLAWDIDSLVWGSGNQKDFQIDGSCGGTLFAAFDIWYNHNTLASTTASQGSGMAFIAGTNDFNYGIQIKNSIIDNTVNCAFFSSDGCGNSVVTFHAPGADFTNNCIYGGGAGMTFANFNGKQLPANQAAVFVNPGTDFHVSGASICHNAASDGLDMGANIDAVNTATAGVVQTLGNLHTVTNVSPSTFTHLGGTGITITGTNFISGEAQVIVGGAGPTSPISTNSCGPAVCTVVTSAPITLAVNDTINIAGGNPPTFFLGQYVVASVTDTTHFTYTNAANNGQSNNGGTVNRYTPGNLCTSLSVTNSATITCTTPAATGTVTIGPVSVFVSQFGIPVQSTVYGNYN